MGNDQAFVDQVELIAQQVASDPEKVNDGIRDAMETAVKLIQNNVKVEEGDEQTSTVETALSDAAGNLAQPSSGTQ